MSDRRSLLSVLVVEDNPDHRALAERALQKAGLVVRTAASGEDALEKVDDSDLVLVDYGLPKMTGIEVLEAIRERSGPPVVLVTGMGSEALAVDALKGGAVDYIVKTPGYLASLPDAVRRAWRAHDLAQRSAELQRITLMVAAAADRKQILSEIARGARELLGASGCGVFVAAESGLSLEAFDGEGVLEPDIDDADCSRISVESPVPAEPTTRLLIPLPGREDATLGVLVVVSEEPRRYLPQEIQLARTFASFAGMTLNNITRLELEKNLVGELQEMLDMRTRLVGSVSHELRTPLTSIVGFSEVLIDFWASLDDDERQKMIGNISSNAKELSSLVDDLLDFATVESGKQKVDVGSLDIAEIVASTVESLGPILQGREVEVMADTLTARGDASLVRRSLTNLLTNAVKYSEADSRIVVRCLARSGACRVEVIDHGRGLTPAEAARAFEPFWRARWAQWPLRGTGVGLFLVREYARLQGGETGVESEPGRGSTFFFTLPLESHLTERAS